MKTKILVISRDPVMLRFLGQNLNESDYQLVTRQDTEDELRAMLEEELPDLIILDIMMPSLDGIEVCLRLRQWCLTPIMMLSAWGAGEGEIRGLNLSADSYLTEPFGADELVVRIKALRQRNLTAAQLLSNIRSGAPWER